MNFLKRIYSTLISFFKRGDKVEVFADESILLDIHKYRGLIWDKIDQFKNELLAVPGAVSHESGTPQSEDMVDLFPLKHNFEGGLYTREVFMPKGTIVVSFIHKQDHPSFVLEGETSVLLDNGEIARYKQGDVIFTKIGTQRVLFMHEDTRWTCVYKTDAKTVEEAEKDIIVSSYKQLPISVINKNKLL